MRREARAAGAGEWLAAALLVSAFYLEPVAGNAPWLASLALTCLAGGAFVLRRPQSIRWVPLVLVAYVAIYALSGLVAGFGNGSEVARYLVRPAAIGALAVFLTTPDSRRRVLIAVVALTLPQVVVTGLQAVDARLERSGEAAAAADSVVGTFGDYGGGPATLVALAALCLVAGHAVVGLLGRRLGLVLAVALLSVGVFSATRAAVVFVPVVGTALVLSATLAAGRPIPARRLAAILAVAVLASPAMYLGTEALFPNAFKGAFSNQGTLVLGDGSPSADPGQKASPEPERRDPGQKASPEPERGDADPVAGRAGPTGVALLPGRVTQLKQAVQISVENGARVFLLGRGFGATAVPEDAVRGSTIPKERRTGGTWLGRILGDAGWLGVIAFIALVGWLAWTGMRMVRRATNRHDVALGYSLPAFATLTLIGASYTTILDVRPYSAVFIVLVATAFAAARDSRTSAEDGDGRWARPSMPFPSRQHATSAAPSAQSARSS